MQVPILRNGDVQEQYGEVGLAICWAHARRDGSHQGFVICWVFVTLGADTRPNVLCCLIGTFCSKVICAIFVHGE